MDNHIKWTVWWGDLRAKVVSGRDFPSDGHNHDQTCYYDIIEHEWGTYTWDTHATGLEKGIEHAKTYADQLIRDHLSVGCDKILEALGNPRLADIVDRDWEEYFKDDGVQGVQKKIFSEDFEFGFKYSVEWRKDNELDK